MLSIDLANRQLGSLFYDVAYPKRDYETGAQKAAENDDLIWTVNVLVRQPGSKRTETIAVTVPSPECPNELFDPFEPVLFAGLRLLTGKNAQGRTWVSFFADKIGYPPQQQDEG